MIFSISALSLILNTRAVMLGQSSGANRLFPSGSCPIASILRLLSSHSGLHVTVTNRSSLPNSRTIAIASW